MSLRMPYFRHLSALLAIGLAVPISLISARTAHAAEFQVANLDDSGTGSLRAQIQAANDSPGADTISFAPELEGTLTLASALGVSSDIRLQADPYQKVTLSGNNATRLFQVSSSGSLKLLYLTLRDGLVRGLYDSSTGLNLARGGAIFNEGNLEVWNCLFNGNSASILGGSISDQAIGGAIFNARNAKAAVINSTFAENQCKNLNGSNTSGEAIGSDSPATLRIVHTTINGGSGTYNNAIQAPNNYTLLNSIVGGADTGSGQSNSDTGNFFNAGKRLGPLSDNGGPTLSYSLLEPEYYAIPFETGKRAHLPADSLDLDEDGDTTEFAPYDVRGPGFPRRDIGWITPGALQYPQNVITTKLTLTPTPVRVNGKADISIEMSSDGSVPNDSYSYRAVWKVNGEVIQDRQSTFYTSDLSVDLSRTNLDVTGATLSCEFTVTSQVTGRSSTRVVSTILNEAGSLVVNTNTDSLDEAANRDDKTSLREALNFAATLAGPNPVITFDLGDQEPVIQLVGTLYTFISRGYQSYGPPCTILNSGATPIVLQGKTETKPSGQVSPAQDSFPLLNAAGDLSVEGLTFRYGRGTRDYFGPSSMEGGGAIQARQSLVVRRCQFENNIAIGEGGAINAIGYVTPFQTIQHTISIEGCRFSNNSAATGGGAVYFGSRYPFDSQIASASIVNCSFVNNLAAGGGGAVANNAANLNVFNSTFTGNKSDQGRGGAIVGINRQQVVNCTFAGNQAGLYGGAVAQISGALNVTNNIFANNSTPNGLSQIDINGYSSSSSGTITDQGHNLVQVEDPSETLPAPFTSSNNILTTEARLSPLKDNGGLVPTMRPVQGSPAIDAGRDTSVAPYYLTTDGRGAGFPRRLGVAVDIGAFEGQTASGANLAVLITPQTANTNSSLVASTPAVDGSGATVALAYQWKKNGVNISRATTSTLDLSRPGNGDQGDEITCVVTAIGSGSSSTRESEPVTIEGSSPAIVSISPRDAVTFSKAPVSFAVTYEDEDGPADIGSATLLASQHQNEFSSLYVLYDRASNKLYLRNDTNTQWLGGHAPGSPNTLSNAWGRLNCASTTVKTQDGKLVVSYSLTAENLGTWNLLGSVEDSTGLTANRRLLTTWKTDRPAPSAPTIGANNPASGNSISDSPLRVVTTTSDEDGAAAITDARIIIHSSLSAANALAARFTGGKLYLYSDDGKTQLGGFAPGSINRISNSQGTLDCSETFVTRNGNDLQIHWCFIPKGSFTGQKSIYVLAIDNTNLQAGWTSAGQWNITANTSAPVNVSLTPTSGSSSAGVAREFTAVYSDPNGADDINFATLDFTAVSGERFRFYYSEGLLYVDAPDTFGGYVPGSNVVVSAPYGKVDISKSTVTKNGNTLTITWNFAPTNAVQGLRTLSIYARDSTDIFSGNQKFGTWTIDANPAPSFSSVTPATATSEVGQPTFLTSVFQDNSGANDITEARVLVNTTLGPLKTLTGRLVGNLLYLMSDDGKTSIGGFPVGSNNLIRNGQGALDCSKTAVTRVGTVLTIKWCFIPNDTFTGTKNVYGIASDTTGQSSPWTAKGTWTIATPATRPYTSSVTPVSGSSAAGQKRTLTATYKDAQGGNTITDVRILINTSLTTASSLTGRYFGGKLYLLGSDGKTFIGGFAPGSNNLITSPSGTLDCAGTTVTTDGDTLTINWQFTPSSAIASRTHQVYSLVRDATNLETGWDQVASWSITAGSAAAIRVQSSANES